MQHSTSPTSLTTRQRVQHVVARLVLVLIILMVTVQWISELDAHSATDRPAETLTEAGKSIEFTPYTVETLSADIANTQEKPLLLFVYTSWCPYCHKMYPILNEAALTQTDLKFSAISIDKDRAAIANYLATQKPSGLVPHTINDPFEQVEFINALQREKLRFNGGIPFLAVFYKGKPIAEVPGALEKAEFNSMVSDILATVKADASSGNL